MSQQSNDKVARSLLDPSGREVQWPLVFAGVKNVVKVNNLNCDTLNCIKGWLKSNDSQLHVPLLGLTVLHTISLNCSTVVRNQMSTPKLFQRLEKQLARPQGPQVATAIVQVLVDWTYLFGQEELGARSQALFDQPRFRQMALGCTPSQAVQAMQGDMQLGVPPVAPIRGEDFIRWMYRGASSNDHVGIGGATTGGFIGWPSVLSGGLPGGAPPPITTQVVSELCQRMQADAQRMISALATCRTAARLQRQTELSLAMDAAYREAERCSQWRRRAQDFTQRCDDPGGLSSVLAATDEINQALQNWQQFTGQGMFSMMRIAVPASLPTPTSTSAPTTDVLPSSRKSGLGTERCTQPPQPSTGMQPHASSNNIHNNRDGNPFTGIELSMFSGLQQQQQHPPVASGKGVNADWDPFTVGPSETINDPMKITSMTMTTNKLPSQQHAHQRQQAAVAPGGSSAVNGSAEGDSSGISSSYKAQHGSYQQHAQPSISLPRSGLVPMLPSIPVNSTSPTLTPAHHPTSTLAMAPKVLPTPTTTPNSYLQPFQDLLAHHFSTSTASVSCSSTTTTTTIQQQAPSGHGSVNSAARPAGPSEPTATSVLTSVPSSFPSGPSNGQAPSNKVQLAATAANSSNGAIGSIAGGPMADSLFSVPGVLSPPLAPTVAGATSAAGQQAHRSSPAGNSIGSSGGNSNSNINGALPPVPASALSLDWQPEFEHLASELRGLWLPTTTMTSTTCSSPPTPSSLSSLSTPAGKAASSSANGDGRGDASVDMTPPLLPEVLSRVKGLCEALAAKHARQVATALAASALPYSELAFSEPALPRDVGGSHLPQPQMVVSKSTAITSTAGSGGSSVMVGNRPVTGATGSWVSFNTTDGQQTALTPSSCTKVVSPSQQQQPPLSVQHHLNKPQPWHQPQRLSGPAAPSESLVGIVSGSGSLI